MSEIAKSDVFFFITSGAIILLTVIIAVLLVYIFLIVRNVKKVVDKVKEESVAIIDDVKELHFKLKADESALRRASSVFVFLRSMFFGKRKKRNSRE